ncbi:hypothetical protein M9980_09380 [Sphingomonas donggukensis]|uniref:Lipoprotein n=1 Tax=Sphingomonas donggukensis TaxID=2949093 RepID=A0ABY4TS78_9SPHN|nr:hypothetical protein [Sphingomonas donggukensis]URW74784.1 hypothetical protein M9980_09380 [Sphingomonas donggukensis]
MRRILPALTALLLAACSAAQPVDTAADSLDQELAQSATGSGDDPMLAAALADPLMTDPGLAGRANADAIRPPAQPYSAAIPADDVAAAPAPDLGGLTAAPAPTRKDCPQCAVAGEAVTLAALAARQAAPHASACASQVRYAAGWANRLGRDVPLYINARVIEAAGVQTAQCRLRLASFTAAQPVQTMLDWYFTRTRAAGFVSEQQSDATRHVLTGRRARDGAAYALYLTARADGGSDVDLVTTTGT